MKAVQKDVFREVPLFPRSLQPHSLIRHAGNYQHLWSEKQNHYILGIWVYVIVRAGGTVHNRLFLTGATDCKPQGRQKRKMDMKWKKRGRAKTCEAEVKLPWTEWNLHCFLTSSKSTTLTKPLSCTGALGTELSSRSWWNLQPISRKWRSRPSYRSRRSGAADKWQHAWCTTVTTWV